MGMICKASLAIAHPTIAAEWHPTKNGRLTPYDVTPGSSTKKVWWLASCGHEWTSTVQPRVHHGHGCPYCSGQRVCDDNCLARLYPAIADEWHPTKNGKLTARDVTSGTDRRVWWLAPCGHEWEATIANRTGRSTGHSTGCPYCSGQRTCHDNCLSTLYPEIAVEWHPTMNGTLIPSDVTARSGRRKVWWKCQLCDHDWQTAISNCTIQGTGCPVCCESHGEKQIRGVLGDLRLDGCLISFCEQYKHPTIKNLRCLPFDFCVKFNDSTIGLIEYNGEQHYQTATWSTKICQTDAVKQLAAIRHRDDIKRIRCHQLEIPLIVIKYTQIGSIKHIIQSWVRNNGKHVRRRLTSVCQSRYE